VKTSAKPSNLAKCFEGHCVYGASLCSDDTAPTKAAEANPGGTLVVNSEFPILRAANKDRCKDLFPKMQRNDLWSPLFNQQRETKSFECKSCPDLLHHQRFIAWLKSGDAARCFRKVSDDRPTIVRAIIKAAAVREKRVPTNLGR